MLKPTQDKEARELIENYITECGDNWDKYFSNPSLPHVIAYSEATEFILKIIDGLGYTK